MTYLYNFAFFFSQMETIFPDKTLQPFENIEKTRLFKYTENFTTKNMKIFR